MRVEDAQRHDVGQGRLKLAEASSSSDSSHEDDAATRDLRAGAVYPPILLALRLKSWLVQRARMGSREVEDDCTIATHLRAMSAGCYTVAVIGPKGGAGKTTTALTAGLICAQYLLARPIVVELNPDWGNARELLGDVNPNTIQDLLGGLHSVQRRGIGAIQGYVTMWGRLPVLTAPSDPDGMADLSPRDYDRVLRSLAVHYNLIILDCGTSFTQRLNQYAIQTSDHILVVGNPRHATMAKTVEAVRYIASQRYADKYRGSLAEVDRSETHARAMSDMTLVVQGILGHSNTANTERAASLLPGVNAVAELPHSAELARMLDDGVLTIEQLPAAYRRAMKQLLAAVLARLAQVDKEDR